MSDELSFPLPARSAREFFLIHGYTGSPTDFHSLPARLHRAFYATVRVPLLLGHGTQVQDLDDVTFSALLSQVEKEVCDGFSRAKKIIVGGMSFGGLLALALAGRYPHIRGVFCVSAPYRLKFPLMMPGLHLFSRFKKYWDKNYLLDEAWQKECVYYKEMHSNGLRIVSEARTFLKDLLPAIQCPTLLLQSENDIVVDALGAQELYAAISSQVKKLVVFPNSQHNILYSSDGPQALQEILNFFH